MFDFSFTFFRVSNTSLPLQFILIFISTGFVMQDVIFLFGLCGIFLYPENRLKLLLLAYILLPLIVTTRSVGIGTLGWYYLIPHFPFFAVGVGMLLFRLLQEVFRFCKTAADFLFKRLSWSWIHRTKPMLLAFVQVYLIFLVFIGPAALSIWISVTQLKNENFATSIDFVLLEVGEAQRAVNFINQQVRPDDLVLASPAIAWALKGNVTDYQISLASSGVKTIHFPANMPADRFRFNPSVQNAKFIVVDNIWRGWAETAVPELIAIRHSIEKYPIIYQSENIIVYQLSE